MSQTAQHPAPQPANRESIWQVFLVFLRLGTTSFGGPVAHLGYFRDEFVHRRKWLSERSYADLVALCQFLPGPASSQVGLALGLSRQGLPGALAAWMGFTLPSAIALIIFALSITGFHSEMPEGALHGLKVVAVAVVAQAVWGMAKTLCPDLSRISIMAISACIALLVPTALGQIGVIVGAGIIGIFLFKPAPNEEHEPLPINVSHVTGVFWLVMFFVFLFGLPLLAASLNNQALSDFSAFYRTGSLVFGGGHVVLPLLQASVVPQGLVSNDLFLAGYGAAQAVPGPLFTFAAFLGAAMSVQPTGWIGGFICLAAIFLPSFFLVMGGLPFWEHLRKFSMTQAALMSVNAAVVGLLLAALYKPVWTSAILNSQDFGLAVAAFVVLVFWKLPPWLVVISCGIAGWGLALVS